MSNTTAQINWVEEAEQGDAPQALSWRVRTNSRVKNLKIQIFPHGGVEVVAPPRARPHEIEAFVAEHTDWINKTRCQFAKIRPAEPTLPEGIYLRALDETVKIHFSTASKAGFRELDGLLTVRAQSLNGSNCWPLMHKWLKARAKQALPALCMQTGHSIGLEPKRVHIRLQKTRWGSCSSANNINLSLHLMTLPFHLIDYIILHELCHTIHKNHGSKFHQLLEKVSGNSKQLDKEVKQHQIVWG